MPAPRIQPTPFFANKDKAFWRLQTTGWVTVAQEVETLKLYLDIERMRFEERLRTTFHIDPASEVALLPSLLLQPLVENAIKYAVSPQEAGAEITIHTALVAGGNAGQRLRITVSDTGPGQGADGTDNRQSGLRSDGGESVSTGVGLVNIRERLVQSYGPEHRFDTFEPAEGGFGVTIELPFEPRVPTVVTPRSS